ncbi:beta-1,3-galactosyl-O-glycosyl-glycoprotein beta-1,6-N-acetylglucosaminyltransferase-like [Brachionichthys hirsutus]|uniref:beta-1,3-galactosyl-O-glycosyl-glycoprotein beta-1,6-N-acetylglucosaminyltransferase-like n=1 Tax=Brachionichthys hirsutus TaxID=412623 RepID=UPI003604B19A
MKLLKRGVLQLLLKSAFILVSFWMLLQVRFYAKGRHLSVLWGFRWLEYTGADGRPENVCNCSAIFRGKLEAIEQAKMLAISRDFRKSVRVPDEFYVNTCKNCRKFKIDRKYILFPLSQEEENFPLAYSMVVHQKVQTFERLLRAIYAPQNFYCIHVDTSAEPSVISAISAIASCFPNVFLVSKPVNVVYSAWSRVQADLNCMADLYNISTKWKYFINLCGQDFPIKTNLEIVKTLQSLRGGNSMESEKMHESKKWRVLNSHQIVDNTVQGTGQKKAPPPFDLPILSGNAYIVVNRGYVRSVLEDNRIHQLIEWANDTYSPDEFIWATIQRMPGVPGSTRPSIKYDMTDINALARLVKWSWHEGSDRSLDAVYPECQGSHVRAICVYGAGDLSWMLEQHHLFANKFDVDTDSIAVYCLEKYLRQKALSEMQ